MAWIPARVLRWSVLSDCGLFNNAQRVLLIVEASSARPPRRSSPARCRRTSPVGLGRPRDDLEGVQAQHRTRCPRRDHGVDELRAVRADVGQRGGALGAEVVEEPTQRLLSCGPSRPTPACRCRGT